MKKRAGIIFLLSLVFSVCYADTNRPVLTTAGVVTLCPDNKIILIERGKKPFGLAMFGGHVEYESPLDAFRREAKEELSLRELKNIRLIGVHGEPGRDPRQHSVEITYSCTTTQKPQAASDAKAIKLYSIPELENIMDSQNFAFDHKMILMKYFRMIEGCNPCQEVCEIGVLP